MKINLSSTWSDEPTVQFIAETEFEKRWLKEFSDRCHVVTFDFQYPCTEPKELNNPTICLKVVGRKEDKK